MIKVENLVKSFGAKHAVDDVSFSVERNRTLIRFRSWRHWGRGERFKSVADYRPPASIEVPEPYSNQARAPALLRQADIGKLAATRPTPVAERDYRRF